MASGPGVQRTVRLSDYPNGLPLQNVDRKGRLVGKSDMSDLPNLHEAAILYNLKERHARGVPYTRVGDIVVACNPFRWIDGLYSEEKRDFYSEHLIWNADHLHMDVVEESVGSSNYDGIGGDGPTTNPAASAVEPKTYKSDYDRLGYDPHVYETSCLAYRGLAIDKRDQSIVVSGESGAGKTETVKIVLRHLATAERTRPGYQATTSSREMENAESASTIVQRVLKSNPIFESFGNAKTMRNDNSSRFGKFTRLQFDVEASSAARAQNREVPACLLAGSTCTTYLLEKSRVVSHALGERTYHIFYQLLAAPEDVKTWIWDGLGGTGPETFACVGGNEGSDIEGRSDADWWERTVSALGIFGLRDDELRDMMRALCVVMQLGNLTFAVDPESEHHEQAIITSRDDLDLLSDIIGIEANDIEQSLTVRTMKMRGDEIKTGLAPAEAKDGCDALAKELYARLFDLLVRRMNDYTKAEVNYVPSSGQSTNTRNRFLEISLLDIFGFENFVVNRFEQLAINFANERLQNRYAVDIFSEVKEEYESEGIEIFDFSKVDNSDILHLLEGRMGLIPSLNEECKRPKGNDASFVYKLKTMHTDSKYLIQTPLDLPTQFGIQHFAGAVSYDASNFVERNTDRLPDDLLECACKSTNNTIRREFQELSSSVQHAMAGAPKRGGTTTKHTVITTFKIQLSSLMENIEKTKTRYIRCIKPNFHMQPNVTNHVSTMTQLQSAGLVTAIAITRESFPNRLLYDTVIERFNILIPPEQIKRSGSLREQADFLLVKILHITDRYNVPYALGKTKVYFRAGALERLESIRIEYFASRAILIQTWARLILAGWRYHEMRNSAITIQSQCRAHLESTSFKRKRNAAIILQCATRCLFAVWEIWWRREERAASLIQNGWRMVYDRVYFLEAKYAAMIIQRSYRNKRDQILLKERLSDLLENAEMDDRLSKLQQQVHVLAPETERNLLKPVNGDMMQEVENMFEYLRTEISDLRQENEHLKVDKEENERLAAELSRHVESTQAAAQIAQKKLVHLETTNDVLASEAKASKRKVAELKKELKDQEEHQVHNVGKIRGDYETAIADRDVEIRKLKGDLKASKRALRMEREMLTDEVERVQEEHLAEVSRLKNELKKTRDSHHDYLAKLMDVLETTHAAREEETAKLTEELKLLRLEKSTETEALNREIEQLREKNENQHNELAMALSRKEKNAGKAAEKKEKDLAILKSQLEQHAMDRKKREVKFRDLSDALDDEIALLETSHQEVSRPKLGRKSNALDEAPLVFEGPPSNLQQLLFALKSMYKSEQDSHISVEQETLRLSERFLSTPAEGHNGFNKQMAQALKATQEENIALKEQIARLSGKGPVASPMSSNGSSIRLQKSMRSSQGVRSDNQGRNRSDVNQAHERSMHVDRSSSQRRLQQVKESKKRQHQDAHRSEKAQQQQSEKPLQNQHQRQLDPRDGEETKARNQVDKYRTSNSRAYASSTTMGTRQSVIRSGTGVRTSARASARPSTGISRKPQSQGGGGHHL